ncbi:trypsin-like serine peptidase [Sorangium sp. So ce854]|uniref:trypsin-like serine peptidase n=1 Tax=Sorangium sp. So ce854 TaxID=3133322 RepID=UPI003F618FE8
MLAAWTLLVAVAGCGSSARSDASSPQGAATASRGPASIAGPKGLDGDDDRTECGARAQCNAVALLVHHHVVKSEPGSPVVLETETHQRADSLCAGARFAMQPVIKESGCTGFLVERRVLATAGHCVIGKTLEDLRAVFGYRMDDGGVALAEISPQQVYRVVRARTPPRNDGRTGEDWALLELDGDVSSVAPLQLEHSAPVREGDPVFMIGHPLGLPLKHADNAVVRVASRDLHFIASLDAFHGNSGSPVFNASGKVVGLLSGGTDADVLWRYDAGAASDAGCAEVNRSPPGSAGKKVTRSSAFASMVKDGAGASSEGTVARQ